MISLIVLLAGLAAFIYHIETLGRDAAGNDQMKQELDDVKKANDVRADLDNDPAAAGGCATNSPGASFCDIYQPVYMSRKDTEATKKQIDGNNAVWVALCGK